MGKSESLSFMNLTDLVKRYFREAGERVQWLGAVVGIINFAMIIFVGGAYLEVLRGCS